MKVKPKTLYPTDKHKLFAKLSKGTILDIGFAQCPNKFLEGDVFGLDIQDCPKPSNYLLVDVCNFNKQNIPFSDNRFDTVIIGDVIEHVENPTKLLCEINRVLKPGGIMLLSTPVATYYWSFIDDWLLFKVFEDPEHEHLSNWTKRDMVRLLKKNGFMTDKIYGAGADIPILRVHINNKNWPVFGNVLVYVTHKFSTPDRSVIVNKDNSIDGEVKIKQ